MKISGREKNLLILLLLAIGMYLFYTFVYVPQGEKLETLKQAGNKSVRFDDDSGITIPCKVKRVYCDYDFSNIYDIIYIY